MSKPFVGFTRRNDPAKNRRKWWEYSHSKSLYPLDILIPGVYERHTEEGVTTHIYHSPTFLAPDDLRAKIGALAGNPVLVTTESNSTEIRWQTPHNLLYLSTYKMQNRLHGELTIGGCDPDIIEKIRAIVDPLAVSTGESSDIYIAAKSCASKPITFKHIGSIVQPLQRENYSSEALSLYDRGAKDLKDASPRGRLILFEGPPGTGKTYMIRGVITEVPAAYIIVNPKNFNDLMDPEFVFGLQSLSSSHSTIVLVLEDADKLLQPRQKGASLEGLSSALNMGDGLLSGLMDLRLIVTTNAAVDTIDPALLRTGRLSARIHIGPLPTDQANEVLRKHAPAAKDSDLFTEPTVLSDVYDRVRDVNPDFFVEKTGIIRSGGGYSEGPGHEYPYDEV